MKKKPQAILFDLDDTLLPSSEAYQAGLRAVGVHFEKYGTARALVKRTLGNKHPSSHSRLLYFKKYLEMNGDFSARQLLEMAAVYEKEVLSFLQRQWLDSGRLEFLSRLASEYALGLVTNETTRMQVLKLNAIDPENKIFKAFVTSEECGIEKPSPKIFKEALKRLGTKARETVMVGDSWEDDIVPARKLGFSGVVWTQEFKPPAKNLRDKSVRVLDKLERLPEVLAP